MRSRLIAFRPIKVTSSKSHVHYGLAWRAGVFTWFGVLSTWQYQILGSGAMHIGEMDLASNIEMEPHLAGQEDDKL